MALPATSVSSVSANTTGSSKKFLFPFIMITSLFFFWGFIINLNPLIIAHLKYGFQLKNLQATLIDSAVYFGYFIMAIPAGLIMKSYGYKRGILMGLCLFALGCFLFIPAANTMQYAFFLGALFIVACGLAMLETAANPYATVLGAPETATRRLNFAQSFNGLAAFLSPLIGRQFILAENPLSAEALATMSANTQNAYLLHETATVKMPYFALGTAILVVACIFFFVKLPDIKDADESSQGSLAKAWSHRQLKWGVIAQFFYVGSQTCILSLLILFATHAAKITDKAAAFYAGMAGLAFMLGRFVGTFLMQFLAAFKLLRIYACICVLLCLVTIFGSGMITVYALVGIAFFMSIMFPTIFALGIENLGADTKSGSSLLIMSIVGGAVLPPIVGYIADITGNFQLGYIVPLIGFVVVGYFGWKGYQHEEKTVEVLMENGM